MRISIVIARGLAEELTRRGLDANAIFEGAGLLPSRLEDATDMLDVETYVRVVDAALAATKDPELGLHVGSNAQATLHIVGHAALACGSMREAADLFLRYAPLLLEDGKFALDVRGDLATFSYQYPGLPPRNAAFGAEFCLAMIHGVAMRFIPGGLAREVRFRHWPKRGDAAYQRVFGCPVRFGAPDNAIVFDAMYLDVRQHHSDAPLVGILRDHAEAMLARRSEPERLPSRIRELVRSSETPADLDVETIAETLGVGARTLRRRLGHGAGGVRAIVASTKREIAEGLLRDPEVPIKEISYRLGFSEPSAFHRAFKRWTQMTPAEYRASARRVSEAHDTVVDELKVG